MHLSPLEIPGIVASVLQHLDSRSLVATAQVNSLWAEEATNCIWRGAYRDSFESLSSPLRRLADSEKERRDWYSKKIRYLTLERSDDDDKDDIPIVRLLEQKGFHFPNVKSLIVDVGSENMKEKDMALFLQPNIVCLELFGGYYTRWFLEQIQKNAPSLRALLLDNRLVDNNPSTALLTEDDFLNFLQAMPSLKHLELIIGWEPLLTEKVMTYLMFRPGLEKLGTDHGVLWRYSTVRRALSENPDLVTFSHLRSLQVTAEEKALRLLLPLLKDTLQRINIAVVDCQSSPVDTPRFASSCTRLEEVIFSWEHGELSGVSLVDLASHCPLLRRVQFESDNGSIVDISDEKMEILASKMSHLEVLSLPAIGGTITSRSLVSLARHCPRLQDLTIPADVEILQLDEEEEGEVHFPSLQRLDLENIFTTVRPPVESKSKEDIAKRIIHLLDGRFPSLTSFAFNPTPPHGHGSDPLISTVRKHLARRSLPFSMPFMVSNELTARLIESAPGSRHNPLS